MRTAPSLFMVLMIAAVFSPSPADKLEPSEKAWAHSPISPTSILPEQEPNNDCPGQTMACNDQIQPAALDPAGDVDWFSFYVDETFRCLTIGTDTYQGSGTDTYLELYDACGGPILAQDDDGGPGYFSLISAFVAPHPGTYYVKVRGYDEMTIGAYTFFVWCTDLPLPPPNDRCEGAYPIERCAAGMLADNTRFAYNDYDPRDGTSPSCTGWSAQGRDVAYVLDLQSGDLCHFVYTQLEADASFYIVTDCANVNESCVIGADATVSGQAETIDWACPATGIYYLILDAYGTDAGGAWTLDYDVACPPPPRVCCVGHDCYLLLENECATMQGQWHPEWESCGPPNPCAGPSPAEPSTWGGMKALFR